MYETGMNNIGIIKECVKKYDKSYKPAPVEYEKAKHEDINFVLNASVEDRHIVDIIYKNFLPAPKYIADIFEETHDQYLKKIENHKVDKILKLSGIVSCILLVCIFVTNIFRV
jgi:Mg2+ and Co2+ transporter CorA